MVILGKYSAAFHLVEEKPRVSQAVPAQVELWYRTPVAWIGEACRRLQRVVGVTDPDTCGACDLKRLKYQRLGSPYILVLFKNADGRVFAEDGLFSNEDLFDLLL
jgi:hypothetical protein